MMRKATLHQKHLDSSSFIIRLDAKTVIILVVGYLFFKYLPFISLVN